MDYLYFFANASLCLRVIEFLRCRKDIPSSSLTLIHQINGWILRVKFTEMLTPCQHGNFRALMSELGIPFNPEPRIGMVLWDLDAKQSPVQVMRRYQVAIVSHGEPDRTEIEAFREQFTSGLGYCPETLA
jgi:hypothetical protein